MTSETSSPDIFAGDDPIAIARRWLGEAELTEPQDANAMALATVDPTGLPDVRIVLLKHILDDGFVFFTNYGSAKGRQIEAGGQAAFVIHWKSLDRQIRVRGDVSRAPAEMSDDYYNSRSLDSRLGAWASDQSRPLASRQALMEQLDAARAAHGDAPKRPPFWGGFCIRPVEMEFWADGAHRLHDRFRWVRLDGDRLWEVTRLNP